MTWIHDNSPKDTSSNTIFGRIRQLVECNVWSKWTVGLNLYFIEMCLKFVKNWSKISNMYQEKNRKGNNFILNSAGKSLVNSLFGIFFSGASCVLEAASLIHPGYIMCTEA